MGFKDNIKYLRKQNCLSQENIASALNYSIQTISKWETGEAIPSYENLAALSKLFGVSVITLMEQDLVNNSKLFIKHSSLILDSDATFVDFKKEVYKFLYKDSNNLEVKIISYKKRKGVLFDSNFSRKSAILLNRDCKSVEKLFSIINYTIEELKNDSLVDYYSLIIDEDKLIIKYKLNLI